MGLQDRLLRQEQQIQMLMGKTPVPPSQDKEITIRQIVEDERKLLENRHEKDVERMIKSNEENSHNLAKEGL